MPRKARIDAPGALVEAESAVFFRYVNGSPFMESSLASVGTVISNARVFYRNSLSTSTQIGAVPVTAEGATATVNTIDGQRTLIVYAVHNGNETLIEITEDPLLQEPALSQRRVINATADIELVSVAYDTTYRSDSNTPHVARDVAFGTTSDVHDLTQERRGTMYVYNSETLEEIYTLPIDLGPLGNSYSLIVVGSKEHGYEALVLQEF